jgi:hypothetical protein
MLVRRRRTLGLTALVMTLVVLGAAPASARLVEEIRAGRRIGPIRLGATTLSDTRAWFGEPTARRRVQLGCIRAIRARWGRRLVVFYTVGDRTAVQGTVRKRTITSDRHGDLSIHTRRGLGIGDRNRKLHRLYPNARRVRHRRHWDHFLTREGRPRLVAITRTKRGRVAALFSGPYETC